jgi:hypothetical protein
LYAGSLEVSALSAAAGGPGAIPEAKLPLLVFMAWIFGSERPKREATGE